VHGSWARFVVVVAVVDGGLRHILSRHVSARVKNSIYLSQCLFVFEYTLYCILLTV
jgi:hypothetical protein